MGAEAAGIGIVVGIVVGCTAFIFVVRHFKRQSTAAKYGIAPEQVTFRCGFSSWIFGCFLFWPVVCCPIDVDDGNLQNQRTMRTLHATTTQTNYELQMMRRELAAYRGQMTLGVPPPVHIMRYADEENQLSKGYSSDKGSKRQKTPTKTKGMSQSGSRRSRSESSRIPDSRL